MARVGVGLALGQEVGDHVDPVGQRCGHGLGQQRGVTVTVWLTSLFQFAGAPSSALMIGTLNPDLPSAPFVATTFNSRRIHR
jgi:hypothetical protein